ncbi:MAG: hypothetical protein RLZZ58_802, partial [Pseudomonadota bacterium]
MTDETTVAQLAVDLLGKSIDQL